jgi:hypothetical protein
MALKSFVDEARKTNKLMEQLAEQKNSSGSIIDVSEGQGIPKEKLDEFRKQQTSGLPSQAKEQFRAIPNNKPKTDFEKKYLARNSETNNYSTPINGKQKVDDRHGNIIANMIKKSGTTTRGDSTWENCKYKKDCDGTIYCTEFHSLCGKDKCSRATR